MSTVVGLQYCTCTYKVNNLFILLIIVLTQLNIAHNGQTLDVMSSYFNCLCTSLLLDDIRTHTLKQKETTLTPRGHLVDIVITMEIILKVKYLLDY